MAMESPEANLRLMCSSGGRFSGDPARPLRYVGGDTRVVSLPRRSSSLRDLRAKLSRLFSPPHPFSLQYLLPSSSLLLPLSLDAHLQDLLLHHDRLPRPSRIRLFLLSLHEEALSTDAKSSSSSSYGSLGSSSAEEDLELVGKTPASDGAKAPEADSCLERLLFFQESDSPIWFESKHEDETVPSDSTRDTVQSQVAELAEAFIKQQLHHAHQSAQSPQHQPSNLMMPLPLFYPVHTQPSLPQGYRYSPQMPMFFMPAQPSPASTTPVPRHDLVDARGIAAPSSATSVPLPSMVILDRGSAAAFPMLQPPPIPRFLHRTEQSHQPYAGLLLRQQSAPQDAGVAGYQHGNANHGQPMFYATTACTQLLPQYQAVSSSATMMLSNAPQ